MLITFASHSSYRALVAWSHHSLTWTPLQEGMGQAGKPSPECA